MSKKNYEDRLAKATNGENIDGLKTFNKGISDLELLANFERLAFVNRSTGNLKGWADVLQAWRNKLHKDIPKEKGEKVDRDLKTIKLALGGYLQGFKKVEFEETLNETERFLYQIHSEIGIDNPEKKQDSFFQTDEDW